MECTQRLECTQDLYESQSTQKDKESFEQIGFLGICGKKYPVKKGPNKIGRDPQTCNIVLNLNSVSRQHAVINVLHKKQFMLMDLDSANKTKLSGKTLQPYVPQPLTNGDTVQFGEIFGIFRLNDDDDNDDLPMTQTIDVPDTPVYNKHKSRFTTTTVPESPDVSDKDDSYILPSQPKGVTITKNKNNFIKPGKTIAIQPIGSKIIDNIFWKSSKKSTSINLDDSVNSDNVTSTLVSDMSIHEVDTQEQVSKENNEDCIYSANTQVPSKNKMSPSIYSANTQMPGGSPSIYTANTQIPNNIHTANTQATNIDSPKSIHTENTQPPDVIDSPSIHSLDTQLPTTDNLPRVRKLHEQQDMQLDLYTDNKENENIIHNAETQAFTKDTENARDNSVKISNNINISNDEIIFDDVGDESFDKMESQAILTDDIILPSNRVIEPDVEPEPDSQSQIIKPKSSKRNMRISSDGSTDCEDFDMLPTQKISEVKGNDDDETDCEDEMIELNVDVKTKPDEGSNFEDLATQVILISEDSPVKSTVTNIEDLPTQVLDVDNNVYNNPDFEDLPTQVIGEDLPKNPDFEDLPTQVIKQDLPKKQVDIQPVTEVQSPFKIPLKTAVKAKKRDSFKTPKIKPITDISKTVKSNLEENEKYYQDTQDIFDDLCSQRIPSPDIGSTSITEKEKEPKESSSSNKFILDQSFSDTDAEEKVSKFVSNLSSQDIREVIGVSDQVAKPKRMASDSSDVDVTPKKVRPLFMDIDLPNSQEIKTSVSCQMRASITESSSDSEMENNSEEQCTPILFHKRKKPSKDSKMNLTKVFDAQALPTRVITRVRKPTSKVQESQNKQSTKNILKPKFLTEQEDNIDKEIITENISRLKTSEKSKVIKVETEKKPGSQTKSANTTVDNAHEKPTNSSAKRGRSRKQIIEVIDDDLIYYHCKGKKRSSKETKNEKLKTDKSKINEGDTKALDSTVQSKSNRTLNSKTNDKTINTDVTEPKDTEKRTRGRKKEVKEPSPVKGVRRSKRQRTVKEKKETEIKSILKKSTHEHSTVYNVSSGSNSDSPRTLKRSAEPAATAPSAKRTRAKRRNTPAKGTDTQYVLFTAFPYEEVKEKLENLGAVIVTDVMQCTVVLTLQIKRTFKLLCAVGLGRPIVGPQWVQACADSGALVDPWAYLIKDEEAEKRFHFNLEQTLRGERNFLKGFTVCATPSVMPNAAEMKLIVECSGGRWAGEVCSDSVCVSCARDRAGWGAARGRGARLVSSEFILTGVLRQHAALDQAALNA